MDETINYAKYQQRLEQLILKTKQLLAQTDNSDLAQKMDAELQEVSERKELRLAFVGQYSSGKSTIISALTGNKDILIDANIATDKTIEYRWNNITLMDTPGILAGKVEEHDERTKAALKECDLIFYVLTSQLFDDVIFNNFIDLAYNQHLADKMFIVVNKMNMEYGDYAQLVQNYTASLHNTFKERGYDFSAFPIAFIDANDYLEGVKDGDDEFIQVSNFEKFINDLNSFVSSKGLIKKQFDTPVRVLQSYAKDIAISEVDQNLAEFYRQFEQRLSISEKELKRDVSNVLYSFETDAMTKVSALSSGIGSLGEAEWKVQQEELNRALQQSINTTSTKIEKVVEQNYADLLKEVEDFGYRDTLAKYISSIDAKLNSPNISIEERNNLNSQKRALDWLKSGATKIGDMAPGVNGVFGGISNASGSQLHNIVLNVGHFFGKSFRPWEAVRWASNIAKVAKFGIPVVTAGIDIWMQLREEKKENERLQQIKESKNQFITGYQGELNKVKGQFEDYLNTVLKNYRDKRNDVNKSKDEIIRASKRNDAINKSINELEGEYVDFIEMIEEDK
jgi:tRNA U34 5-carboxymethylaminomethyl modifying GTPase MnmE/TrmE